MSRIDRPPAARPHKERERERQTAPRRYHTELGAPLHGKLLKTRTCLAIATFRKPLPFERMRAFLKTPKCVSQPAENH
jgi:hypothetical protein